MELMGSCLGFFGICPSIKNTARSSGAVLCCVISCVSTCDHVHNVLEVGFGSSNNVEHYLLIFLILVQVAFPDMAFEEVPQSPTPLSSMAMVFVVLAVLVSISLFCGAGIFHGLKNDLLLIS